MCVLYYIHYNILAGIETLHDKNAVWAFMMFNHALALKQQAFVIWVIRFAFINYLLMNIISAAAISHTVL